MWSALRALEERAGLMRKLAENARRRGHHAVETMFAERSNEVVADIEAIRGVIVGSRTFEPVVEADG